MPDDTTPAFGFPAIGRKKLTAAFDGGRITSDGGVLLLGEVERQLGIAETLAGLIEWPTDEPEPTKYFLSTLPANISRRALVNATKLRWRIERDYPVLFTAWQGFAGGCRIMP